MRDELKKSQENPQVGKKYFSSAAQSEIELLDLEAIVESSEDAIYSRDLDGKILSWNKSAERIYGYSAEEVIGRNHSRLLPPDIINEENIVVEKVKRGERLRHYETIRIKKDGSQIQVSLTVSPIKDKDGKVVGISKIARDITEQKNTETALRESENKYRTLIDSMNGGFCVIKLRYDDAGNPVDYLFLEVNPAFEHLSGISAKDALSGKPITQLIPNFERQWVEIFGKVARSGKSIRFESQSKALNRWFDVYALQIGRPEDGKVAIFFDNITVRKLATEKTLRNEQLLRGLINNLFSFVGLLTTDGILLEANQTALASADLEAKDVIGKKFSDTYWWAWSQKVQDQLQSMIARAAADETVRGDMVIRLSEEKFTTIDFQLAPIRSNNGEIIYLVPSGVDISERLQLESELRQSAQISLAGELAMGLAHEIKNPLTGIQGAIDILIRRREINNPERLILESVIHEVGRINDTVCSILDQTKPRSVRLNRSSLTQTVQSAVQVAEHHISAQNNIKRILIKSKLPDAPFNMTHDTALIEDAVLNLLINALEAIGDKTGRITVSLSKNKIADKESAVIKISDTGGGIAETDLVTIFTPFYTTKKIGTGMGLATVKRIAEAHEGRCSVQSVVGQGSTFTLYIPFDL